MNNLHLIQRIVTHSGRFHADEVFAIAFLLVFLQKKPGELHIERTRRDLSQELSDQTVAVIDVGGVHNPTLNNFDHHQDKSIGEASLVHILFAANPWYKNTLLKHIFGPISKRDTGKPVHDVGLSFSAAIGIINEQDGSQDTKFETALWIAYQIMLGLVTKFEKAKMFQGQLSQFARTCENRVLLTKQTHVPRNWQTCVSPEVQFVISGRGTRWSLGGRGTIPQTATQVKWLPNNVAIYPSEEAAIRDACSFLSSPPSE